MDFFLKRHIIRAALYGCFLLQTCILQAQTYYVSPSGNDANNGTSPSTAWATIERVNKATSSLKSGNAVLFERGGTYYGSLQTWNVSGTESNFITFGAYGEGEAPIFSGAKQISGWEQIGGNLWRAKVPESAVNIDILFIDGRKYYPARYPNNGYKTVTNRYSGGMQDNTMNFPDGHWDGATVAFKVYAWEIRRDTVARSYSDGRIDKFGDNADKIPDAGWGFFFLNHINAIDIIGEWVHKKQDATVILCTDKNPNGQLIEYMDVKYGINLQYPWAVPNDCYIRIENIHFRHYLEQGIRSFCGKRLEIRHNIFTDSWVGIGIGDHDECIISENIFSDLERRGIEIGNMKNSRILNNDIRRIGMSLDHGGSAGISIGMFANTHTPNDGCEISGNRIKHVGYNGIFAHFSQNLLVSNNVIDSCMLCLSDGGGIYFGYNPYAYPTFKNNRIVGNIVTNIIGNTDGTIHNLPYPWRHGIYLDDGTGYVTVQGNTVINSGSGVFLHGGHHNTVLDNVLYNNSSANFIAQDERDKDVFAITGNEVRHNYMYQNGWETYFTMITYPDIFSSTNRIDNNYISAPFSQRFARTNAGMINSKAIWSERTGFDLQSQSEPVSYTESGATSPEEYAIVVYNPTQRDTAINLKGTYIDFEGRTYSNSISLQPFKSAILFKYTDNTAISALPSTKSLLSVFPNPVRKGQLLTIQTGTDASIDEFEISIYDFTGKLQKQYHSTQTDISIPAPDNAGYYLLLLKTKNGGIVQQTTILVQ